MTPDEALNLIAAGEQLTIELKVALSSKQERSICKEIAALGTMQGGSLFVGVRDDGGIVGVSDPGLICSKIESWVARYVTPAPVVNVETLLIRNASIVHAGVAQGIAPLYYYDGRPYIRIGTKSVVATPSQAEYLVAIGALASEMRKYAAQFAGIEDKVHPARHTAAAIMGQGELATMSYETLRDRLFIDLSNTLRNRSRKMTKSK